MTEQRWEVRLGDCREVMAAMPAESVDAIVCDPPYGLSFMGKGWDTFKPKSPHDPCVECGNDLPAQGHRECLECLEKAGPSIEPEHGGRKMLGHVSKNWNEKGTHSRGYADNDNAAFQAWCTLWAKEALRVAKPGAHLLAFGGTRTFHRLACALEDAGWEIRDTVMWVYGSGFPKSLDVSKAIDKAAGADGTTHDVLRMATGRARKAADGRSARVATPGGADPAEFIETPIYRYAPATPAAQQWSGWGTALKPAWEPVIVARKPLCGTVAENVLRHGTGAVNVDGCRVAANDGYTTNAVTQGINTARTSYALYQRRGTFDPSLSGRWPANLIHDGSDEVVGLFPQAQGGNYPAQRGQGQATGFGVGQPTPGGQRSMGDNGSAARFFYCAKASKADRDDGCEAMPEQAHRGNYGDGIQDSRPHMGDDYVYEGKRRNHHPTVKPTALMRYLCRLVTPPGGLVLDPFCGSGSTGRGAMLEGFRFLGIEQQADYAEIARARITAAAPPAAAGLRGPQAPGSGPEA